MSTREYAAQGGQKVRADEHCRLWVTRNRGKDNEYDQRVSSAFIVVSEGHNRDNGGASLQLYLKATNGKWNEEFIARKDLTKSDVQGRLVSAGLLPGDWKIIQHVLQNIDPPDKFFALERAGGPTSTTLRLVATYCPTTARQGQPSPPSPISMWGGLWKAPGRC